MKERIITARQILICLIWIGKISQHRTHCMAISTRMVHQTMATRCSTALISSSRTRSCSIDLTRRARAWTSAAWGLGLRHSISRCTIIILRKQIITRACRIRTQWASSRWERASMCEITTRASVLCPTSRTVSVAYRLFHHMGFFLALIPVPKAQLTALTCSKRTCSGTKGIPSNKKANKTIAPPLNLATWATTGWTTISLQASKISSNLAPTESSSTVNWQIKLKLTSRINNFEDKW